MTSIIKNNTVNGVVNQVKATICYEICGGTVPHISVDSFGVSLYGRSKDMLKIECANTYTRNFLFKQAKQRRPTGIYVVEFLPSDKVQVLRSLYKLKNESHYRKITSVYIRGTNIFCKIENTETQIEVTFVLDVDEIRSRLSQQNSDPSPPPSPGNGVIIESLIQEERSGTRAQAAVSTTHDAGSGQL